MYPGINTRLEKEMIQLAPPTMKISMNQKENTHFKEKDRFISIYCEKC